MIKSGVDFKSTRHIYDFLIEGIICKNNSVIPSRSERRIDGVKWSTAWKNVQIVRGLDAEEKVFSWKLQQDMLLVGSRLHRPNADRSCKIVLPGNRVCQEIQSRRHLFIECESVIDIFEFSRQVLEGILQKKVSENELIHLSFTHRNKGTLICALWFAVKMLYKIYLDRGRNNCQLLMEILKEIEWNIKLNRKIGSQNDMLRIRGFIEEYLGI